MKGNLKDRDYYLNEAMKDIDVVCFGVDPGINGGIAAITIKNQEAGLFIEESTEVMRFPKDLQDAWEFLIDSFASANDASIYIEHVHSFPGQGVASTFTFGRNLGQWEGLISASGCPINFISPQKWMGFYETKKGLTRKERKRYLRGIAEDLFPNVKMTFNISDALLIANYCKEMYLDRRIKEMRGEKS
tara:strand:+ start:780 stop:1346 length:567 start_codon:yes stop_codon:yes gene_type:complete